MNSINAFPDDIFKEIFSHVDMYDMKRLERVCKRWQTFLKQYNPILKLFHFSYNHCTSCQTRKTVDLIDNNVLSQFDSQKIAQKYKNDATTRCVMADEYCVTYEFCANDPTYYKTKAVFYWVAQQTNYFEYLSKKTLYTYKDNWYQIGGRVKKQTTRKPRESHNKRFAFGFVNLSGYLSGYFIPVKIHQYHRLFGLDPIKLLSHCTMLNETIGFYMQYFSFSQPKPYYKKYDSREKPPHRIAYWDSGTRKNIYRHIPTLSFEKIEECFFKKWGFLRIEDRLDRLRVFDYMTFYQLNEFFKKNQDKYKMYYHKDSYSPPNVIPIELFRKKLCFRWIKETAGNIIISLINGQYKPRENEKYLFTFIEYCYQYHTNMFVKCLNQKNYLNQ